MSPSNRLSRLRSVLLLGGALTILVGFNHAVYKKTQTLENGRIVKLKLAPRDPRSLLTGDYMTLNYEIASRIRASTDSQHASDGYVVVKLDARGVGEFIRQSASPPPMHLDQIVLHYRQRQREVKFATNAFYFQEGQAKAFEAARYGEFRVGKDGDLLLTHLLDQDLQRISPR